MGKIHLIKDFEKIAAGEVIQRPASVVKELVENSIDAHASQIFVFIKNAGKDLIKIEDNGIGIEEEDLEIAFKRHTSSKMESAADLDHINSLGFRGEALASVAAISQVEIISRPTSQPIGVRMLIEPSKETKKEQCGAPLGTSISVKNLFYNLPVRRKYLKSKQVELGHITDIITRYSLAYPKIHFRLEHNGLNLINSPAFDQSDEHKSGITDSNVAIKAFGFAIQAIYGKKVLDQMEPLTFSDEYLQIYGYLGHPEIGRSDRYAASIFINKRLVQNKKMMQIIYDAYQGYLMRHKYPFFVLFIEIPPEKVDFNIHPSKKTVKFAEEKDIMNSLSFVLKNHIKQAFVSNKNQSSSITTSKKQKALEPVFESSDLSHKSNSESNYSRNSLIKSRTASKKQNSIPQQKKSSSNERKKFQNQTKFQFSTKKVNSPSSHHEIQESRNRLKKNLEFDQNTETSPSLEPKSFLINNSLDLQNIPTIKYLNNGIQAGNTYLIFQTEEGLLIIDQHAAHERINLEKVKQIYDSGKISVQKLLSPIKMDVAPNEVAFIQENLNYLKKIGFELDYFGGSMFLLRTVPAFFSRYHLSNTVIIGICLDLIHMGQEKAFSEIKYEIMQYMACHQSLRAGDEIWDRRTIEKLLLELDSCENPQHCAHGRPTYIKIPYNELEKRFHRIV